MTMTLVSTVTVGVGGAASIEFTGIPQTGKDLMVVLSTRSNAASNDAVLCQFNNDTGANYSSRRLLGDGAAASSSTGTAFFAGNGTGSSDTANTFGNSQLTITNYTSAAAKSGSSDGVGENNATLSYQRLVANLWSGTAAITSLKLLPQFGTLFVQYSTASLYTISTTGATGATVA